MFDSQTATYIIFACALVYSVFSTIVTRKFGNYKRIKEIQDTFNSLSKEMNEASKENNKAKLDEIIARQNAAMPMLWESTVLQLKPLLILLPILFILPGMLRDQFKEFIITLPFQLPVFIQNFENFPNWRDTFGPVGWFWVSVLFCALLVSAGVKAYEEYIKRPRGSAPQATPPVA